MVLGKYCSCTGALGLGLSLGSKFAQGMQNGAGIVCSCKGALGLGSGVGSNLLLQRIGLLGAIVLSLSPGPGANYEGGQQPMNGRKH